MESILCKVANLNLQILPKHYIVLQVLYLKFYDFGGAAVLQNTSWWLLLMEGEEVWSYTNLEKHVFISLERFIVVWKFFLIFQTSLDKFLNQGRLKNLVLGTWKWVICSLLTRNVWCFFSAFLNIIKN